MCDYRSSLGAIVDVGGIEVEQTYRTSSHGSTVTKGALPAKEHLGGFGIWDPLLFDHFEDFDGAIGVPTIRLSKIIRLEPVTEELFINVSVK